MAASDLEALKLHRRTLVLDGRACTVLTPRASQAERFATNFFHGTWHVLTDPAGARLLSRLLWAMSYQRKPRTVLLLDGPMLAPSPFDADPSVPLLIVNSDLGGPSRAGLDTLEAMLPLRTPSEGTVKVRTDGHDRAMADEREHRYAQWDRRWVEPPHQRRGWIDRVHHVLVLAAASPELRYWTYEIFSVADGVDEHPESSGLDARIPNNIGEVQIFCDFTERIERAQAARRARFPGRDHAELLDDERRQIWNALSARPTSG